MGQYWCTVSFLRGGSRKCDTPLEAFCELAIGETEELLQDTLTYASEEMGAVRMTYVLTEVTQQPDPNWGPSNPSHDVG